MELYKEMLIGLLKEEAVVVSFPDLPIDINKLLELECYKTLNQIKEILKDESLSDKECFKKIEEIVCLFESIGSSGGGRHDFG